MNITQANKQKGFTLIEILVVIGIIAILATVVLIAINPARQFKQAHDTQRISNVNAILNAIGQYIADNKGAIPASITTTDREISKAAADLCADIMPKYIPSLPIDPRVAGGPVIDCSTSYTTQYNVFKDVNDRITVKAVGEITPTISVTR